VRAVLGRALVVGAALLVSCRLAGQEQVGDVAYREARFAEALQAYRRASDRADDPGIQAKLGAAALRAGDVREAIDAYRQLASRAPIRIEEAVQGIDLAARIALETGDEEAVREAVFALGTLAPRWPIGRYALSLVQSRTLPVDEALRLIPAAMGAAGDRPAADSLLREYASGLRATASCDVAIHAYRSLRRRTETDNPSVAHGAATEYASCALELGLRHERATPWTAEEYFREAIAVDSTSPVGRRSLVALGDARLAQGDMFGGAMAYQAALDLAAEPDSLVDLATARLNSIAAAGTADDSTAAVP